MPVVAIPWQEAGEASQLAAGQIGVSWLPDDLWSRGKCGLKVLQYQAAGLPVLANPVGCQREMVRSARTACWPQRPPSGSRPRTLLAGDPMLRRRMGDAGRRHVETEYSLSAWAETFVSSMTGGSRRRSGSARQMDRPDRGRRTIRFETPGPPAQTCSESQPHRRSMSICTPQERSTLATATATTLRAQRAPSVVPRMFKPPEWEWPHRGDWLVGPGGSGWGEVLLGPEGLRMDEWREAGRITTVKSGPHRIVYRVELPRASSTSSTISFPIGGPFCGSGSAAARGGTRPNGRCNWR